MNGHQICAFSMKPIRNNYWQHNYKLHIWSYLKCWNDRQIWCSTIQDDHHDWKEKFLQMTKNWHFNQFGLKFELLTKSSWIILHIPVLSTPDPSTPIRRISGTTKLLTCPFSCNLKYDLLSVNLFQSFSWNISHSTLNDNQM